MSTRIDFSVNGSDRPRKASKPSRPTRAETMAKHAEKKRADILAKVCGVGCTVGLALSGIDSTLALNTFAHVPMWRAAMLATVVDGLMVGAELAGLVSKDAHVKRFSNLYILMAGLLSVCLNAAEFASHSTSMTGAVLNAVLGGFIPGLVLVSSRYAGHLWLASK